MGSPMSENSPATLSVDRQMVIQELINGQELTSELRILLRQSSSESGVTSPSAEVIADKVFRCIADALSMLNSGDAHGSFSDLATERRRGPCSADRKVKDSGDKSKIPAGKDQRVGNKRRRHSAAEKILSATPYDDGHVWRKYGQKDILGAKHPRGYFRCTHKHDQGCQATKQVQMSETGASLYVVTYMGQHTCKDVLKSSTPQLMLNSTAGDQLCVLNCESSATMAWNFKQEDHHHHLISSTSSTLINSTVKHNKIMSCHVENPIDLNRASSSPSGNYLASFNQDHPLIDSHFPMDFPMSTVPPDHGDVVSSSVNYSSTTSSRDLDAVDLMDQFELQDVLRFSSEADLIL